MTPHQKSFAAWLKDFRQVCLDFGGVETEPLRFEIATDLGKLFASVHESDYESQKRRGFVQIYLRFETHTGGKVYDTLGGRDFNGYSGKWNIHVSGSTDRLQDVRAEALRQLRESLEFVRRVFFNPVQLNKAET